MQFIQFRRRQSAGGTAMYFNTQGASHLAQVYRAQGFRVDQLTPSACANGQVPDAALLLHRGQDSVLVHAYCNGAAKVSSDEVGHLADAVFEAGASGAVLIGRVGFSARARNAAARLGGISLLDGVALQAMTGGSEAEAWEALCAPQHNAPAATARVAWPLRAAIGLGGVAMAVTMVFAAMPSLQDQLLQKLHHSVPAAVVLPQTDAQVWVAPTQSRSGALNLQATLEDPAQLQQAGVHDFGTLPANFNQSLAPRL